MNAIDREAAADAIHKANMEALNTPGNWMAAGRSMGLTIAENIIRNMPAVEVEPVRHARWDDSGRYRFKDGSVAVRCTACGCALKKDEYIKYAWVYCPICGDRMDGEASV